MFTDTISAFPIDTGIEVVSLESFMVNCVETVSLRNSICARVFRDICQYRMGSRLFDPPPLFIS